MQTFRALAVRLGAGTRARNRDVARFLRPWVPRGSLLLDVGCGEFGLEAYVDARVVGLDVEPAPRARRFVRGSVAALPLRREAVPVAACVDVLEHLPVTVREAAVRELVRVAGTALVLAFPCGPRARRIDERFRTALAAREAAEPAWLTEHLRNPYPGVEAILETLRGESAALRREIAAVRVGHSEPLFLTALLRWAARSRVLYLVVNLAVGVLLPLLPAPGGHNSYRSMILVTFQPRPPGGAA